MRAGTVSSVLEIGREAWNRLATPEGQPFNPFVSFDFFAALEASGSATAKAGWAPRHLVLRDGANITGIAPCYRKTHSQGEYVFDHSWAEAFERAGGRYYPKLQVAVPFTPVPGPRLFGDAKALCAALTAQCAEDRTSSVHITFMPDQDLGPAWLHRTDLQFHWHNAGFTDFAAFLQSLSSSKRKNIRKERDSVAALGVTFDCLTGADIQEAHWDAFFEFYMDTGSRKWGRPYLTRAFFSMIGETMAKHILLVMAKRNGRFIAGAMNLVGSDALYGRNWGAIEQLPNLHFETCYYQAIDWAIAHKLQRVEAGAQGAHKLARGYLPQVTHSRHYLAHPGLARAVAQYLEAERAAVRDEQSVLAQHSPFRHEADT
jgi:predicted N-acyltransferase